jgi:hypothetical protein
MIGLVPVAALLVACTGQSGLTPVPLHTTGAGVAAVSEQATGMSAEEAEAASAPQPALHALQTSQFFAALAEKHPGLRNLLRALEGRSLALTKLQLRAAHALAMQDMKNMTLTEVAARLQRWMDKPAELLAYMTSTLERVEGLDAEQTLRLARMLPPLSVALEALGSDVPTEPAQAAGLNLRHKLIQDFIGLLKAAQPDQATALDDLAYRLKVLSPEEMRALHAIAWAEDKDKTLAQAIDRLTALIQEPGGYAKYLQGHLSQLQGLTSQGQEELVSTYPAALAQLETIMYGDEARFGPGQAVSKQ